MFRICGIFGFPCPFKRRRNVNVPVMKAVVQRVRNAQVTVDGVIRGKIGLGLLVYLGVALDDCEDDARAMATKTAFLRVFDDKEGRMNLSLPDIGGGVLAVSQFTLLADTRRGRRPSYSQAAPPEQAKKLYDLFIREIRAAGLPCEEGVFQARMLVSYTNDGPVTILLDSKEAADNAGRGSAVDTSPRP
jgi:D-tyrosyl-tRNA(Tyr) deacylase